VKEVNVAEIGRFYPQVLDALFQVLCIRSVRAGQHALLSILHVLRW
jgi:hypothetical protein